MVHGQSNNQIQLKAGRNGEKYGCNGEKRAELGKNQAQKHIFSGEIQGVTGRGRYRGCYSCYSCYIWVDISVGPNHSIIVYMYQNITVHFLCFPMSLYLIVKAFA